jgi:hypothetical protein
MPMAAIDILQEANRLRSVSQSLNTLAEQNEPVASALFVLAESVRQSATLLEVVVAVRMPPNSKVENSSN